MATVMSTGASVLVSNLSLTSTRVSPAGNIVVTTPGNIATEITASVPDVGNALFICEMSSNGGVSFFPISVDAVTGRVPNSVGSSFIRFFNRYPVNSTGTYQVRARAADISGTWVVTAKAEWQ